MSMKAGARSAEAILKMLDGESVEYYTDIADGAVYSRFDQSVCTIEGESRIRGVIFDLDDTLYSEKEYIRSGYKAVSDYLGGSYEEKLWKFFESGRPAIDELLAKIGRESEKDIALDIYRSHMPDIHLHNGVEEMLERLKSKGIKIGIITDGRPERQRNKLNVLGLDHMVDDIIITDELGGTQFRKPCDIAFRIMLNRWRLNPADVVYIGDNPVKDFQAPQQLGMRNIWYRNENGIYTFENKCNQRAVNSLGELVSTLFEGEDDSDD